MPAQLVAAATAGGSCAAVAVALHLPGWATAHLRYLLGVHMCGQATSNGAVLLKTGRWLLCGSLSLACQAVEGAVCWQSRAAACCRGHLRPAGSWH